ncbi:hypothetical protein NDU88_001382 [Pleurodeles waltl]|uniref:Uncharacterized protein n=1 Tax=Pleurodeles waltl TaxID=8319 RepID=A0AAV7VXF1_PLEWA|nr:hypothetical protein NDU88_001382 [Pleurodeles waltl]
MFALFPVLLLDEPPVGNFVMHHLFVPAGRLRAARVKAQLYPGSLDVSCSRHAHRRPHRSRSTTPLPVHRSADPGHVRCLQFHAGGGRHSLSFVGPIRIVAGGACSHSLRYRGSSPVSPLWSLIKLPRPSTMPAGPAH